MLLLAAGTHCGEHGTLQKKIFSVVITRSILFKTMLGEKNSLQGPLLSNYCFFGLKVMSPSVTVKHHAYRSGTVNSKSFVGKVLLRIK